MSASEMHLAYVRADMKRKGIPLTTDAEVSRLRAFGRCVRNMSVGAWAAIAGVIAGLLLIVLG